MTEYLIIQITPNTVRVHSKVTSVAANSWQHDEIRTLKKVQTLTEDNRSRIPSSYT